MPYYELQPLILLAQDCYLRFSADDYGLESLDISQHLCNNSISKYYTAGREDDITLAGNMWDVPTFKDWLR